jgi:hypothetical protein
MAYAAAVGNSWMVVADGVEGKRYDRVRPPVFSPDGRHLAYQAVRGTARLIVVDNVEFAYDDIPDDATLVFDGPRTLHTLAVRNGRYLRVEFKIAQGR